MNNTLFHFFIVLFLVNTTTITAQKDTSISSTIKIEIKASNTDKELKEMVKLFKKENINLKFKKIERNHNGEIIGISSSYKGPNGFKGNYSFSGPVPIQPFSFAVEYDRDDEISNISYEKSGQADIIALHTNKGAKKDIRFRVDQNNGDMAKPLFIVDGKEMSTIDAMDLDPNSIKSVSVLKNSSATNMYGEKGKNGVVEVTTKNNVETKSPLIIIDGKIAGTDFDLETIDPDKYEVVSVYKDHKATLKKYGEKARNGVIVLTPKKTMRSKEALGIKPLYVIDGKQMPDSYNTDDLKSDAIESMSILKGKSATNVYGEKGKNGVIVITLKK